MYAVGRTIEAPEIHIYPKYFKVGTKVIVPKEQINLGGEQHYSELAGNTYRVEKIVVNFTNRLTDIPNVATIQNAYKSIKGYTKLTIVGDVPSSCMPPEDEKKMIDVSVESYRGINSSDESFLFEYPNTQNFRSIWSNFPIINLIHVSNLRSLYVEKIPGTNGEYTINDGTKALFIIGGTLQDVTLQPCSSELAGMVGKMIPNKVDLTIDGHIVQWEKREINYFGVNMSSRTEFSSLASKIGELDFGFRKLGVKTINNDGRASRFLLQLFEWLRLCTRPVRKLVVTVRFSNQWALMTNLKAAGMPHLDHVRLIIFERDISDGIFGADFENDFNLVDEIKQFNPEVEVDYKIIKIAPDVYVDFSTLPEFKAL